jgi:hypothetical protein
MSNHAKAILDLLKTRPDLRPVQVADLLDMDLEVAQNVLVTLSKENKVTVKAITAPNSMPSVAYSLPANALNWVSPAPVKNKVESQDTVPAKAHSDKSKPQLALEYLQSHGRVHAKELCGAIGIEYPKYSPTQYLGRQIASGGIKKDGQWYELSTTTDAVAQTAESLPASTVAMAPASQSETNQGDTSPQPVTQVLPSGYTRADLEHVLANRLSPEEYIGHIKASVVEFTLRGEAAAAHEFTGRLVAATA